MFPSQEHNNFFRFSTLLLDDGGKACRTIVNKYCANGAPTEITFQELLSNCKEELFHKRKLSSECCFCKQKTKGNVFGDTEWNKLFKSKSDSPEGHEKCDMNRCPEKWEVNPDVDLDNCDLTVLSDIIGNTKCLLLYFIQDHLNHCGSSFEDFLNTKRHDMYHHFNGGKKCCRCYGPVNASPHVTIRKGEWDRELFERKKKACRTDTSCSCCYKARVRNPDDLSGNILYKVAATIIPGLRKLPVLVQQRNDLFAHPLHDTKMDDSTFEDQWRRLEDSLKEIARYLRDPDYEQELADDIDAIKERIPTRQELDHLVQRIDKMRREEIQVKQELETIYQQGEEILEQVTRERRENMAQTRDRIHEHLKGPRIETRAVSAGREVLEKTGIVVFTGITGQGKTWHCLEVLSHLVGKVNIVQLDNTNLCIAEWDRLVGADDDLIVWIDDLKEGSVDEQKVFFERMKSRMDVCRGNLKFVVSVLPSALKKVTYLHLDIFTMESIIDLNDEAMGFDSPSDRQIMISEFLKFGRENDDFKNTILPINIVHTKREENLLKAPYHIAGETVKEICRIKTNIGFPVLLKQFLSSETFLSMGKLFFQKPDEKMIEVLSTMATEGGRNGKFKFLVLSHILFSHGDIRVNELSNENLSILKDCLKIHSLPEFRNKLIKDLFQTYLHEVNGRLFFQHDTIRTAVALTFCGLDDELQICFVTEGPFDLVVDLCTTGPTRQLTGTEDCLYSIDVDKDVFCKRIIAEICLNRHRYLSTLSVLNMWSKHASAWTRINEMAEELPTSKRTIVKNFLARTVDVTKEPGDFIKEFKTGISVVSLYTRFSLLSLMTDKISSTSIGFMKSKKNVIPFVISRNFILTYGSMLNILLVNRVLHSNLIVADIVEEISKSTEGKRIEILELINDQCLRMKFPEQKILSFFTFCFHIVDSLPESVVLEKKASVVDLCFKLKCGYLDDRSVGIVQSMDSCACEPMYITFLGKILSRCSDEVERRLGLRDKLSRMYQKLHIQSYSVHKLTALHSSSNVQETKSANHVVAITCKCNDIQLFDVLNVNDNDIVDVIKRRFLQEFSILRLWTNVDNFISLQQSCCDCHTYANDKGYSLSFDSLLAVVKYGTTLRSLDREDPILDICNYHLTDLLISSNVVKTDSTLQAALEHVHFERTKNEVLPLLLKIRQRQKDVDDIFLQSCQDGSVTFVRTLLEHHEFHIDTLLIQKGFRRACEFGKSAVADSIVSWKPELVPKDILIEGIELATEHNHSQTLFYLLTCAEVIAMWRSCPGQTPRLHKVVISAVQRVEVLHLKEVLAMYCMQGLVDGVFHLCKERPDVETEQLKGLRERYTENPIELSRENLQQALELIEI